MGSQEGRGPQTDKTPAAKSLYRSSLLDNDIWHRILSVQSFYAGNYYAGIKPRDKFMCTPQSFKSRD
jgi:hypothetical protein